MRFLFFIGGAKVGCTIAPPCVIKQLLIISSSSFSSKCFFSLFQNSSRRLNRLLEYIWLALSATRAGIFARPMIFTPFFTMVLPSTAPSTFPPVSMARSTTTEPGFIAAIISFVTITGALRPKTCAVVITISACAQYCFITSRCFFNCSSVNAFAYPCAVCPVSPRSTSNKFCTE